MKALTVETQIDWDRLCDLAKAPFAQRWIYGAAAARLGRAVQRQVVMNQSHPVALAQIVSRRVAGITVALTTNGPLFLSEVDKKSAVRSLRQTLPRFSIAIATPQDQLRWLRLSRATTQCALDLSQDIDHLHNALHGKWRNALRKAEKSHLKVAQTQPNSQALLPLLLAEKQRQSKGQYRALPPEFTLALQEVAPRSLRLFSACDTQMLFLTHGNSATYHIGYSGVEGRRVNAHNLLLWHAIQSLKAEGIIRLDLGSIDTKRARHLARFKLRTGAVAHHGHAACWL